MSVGNMTEFKEDNQAYFIVSPNDKPVKVEFEGMVLEGNIPLTENSSSLVDTVPATTTFRTLRNLRPSFILRMYGVRLKKWQEFLLDLEWRIKNVFNSRS